MKNLNRVLVAGVLVYTVFLVSHSYGQVTQAWVNRYDGPAHWDDVPGGLAVDPSGNVYVTGVSWEAHDTASDYATVKYDPSGNELWVARYDGPANGHDGANALAVDAWGNVYVTGCSDDSTALDYATVKYDSLGNELWVARYTGPAGGENSATAVALDAFGNIYVTGHSSGEGTLGDYATIKYDSLGNEVWVSRYNNPAGNGYDYAHALAVDAAGNVYVTGTSWGTGTSFDIATVKYDSLGQEQWVVRYNGAANNVDEGNALAVDGSGNVYVTGYANYGQPAMTDYVTLKYDRYGHQEWLAQYQGPDSASRRDEAYDLALDALGNVYVTGGSTDLLPWTYLDYATLKYDAFGNQEWVARYAGSDSNRADEARAVEVDAFGNVYVTGYGIVAGSATGYDYLTLKYDPNGNRVWVAVYNGLGGYSYEEPHALVVDHSGNVYVTGESSSWGYYDYATVKYVPSVQIAFSNTPTAVYRRQVASWQYTLTSTCDTAQTFDWSISIRGLITRDLYLGQKTLSPHATESGTLNLRVPRGAPLGDYLVIGSVGVWSTMAPWDQTSFNCSVVGVGKVESKSTEDWSVEVR